MAASRQHVPFLHRALAALTAFVFAVAIGIAGVVAAPAAHAAGTTIEVDAVWSQNAQGVWVRQTVVGDPDCSLREAIRAANEDRVVAGCEAGVAGETDVLVINSNLHVGGGTVTSDIRIEANGHTFDTDVNLNERLFTVSGDDADLTLQDAIVEGITLHGGSDDDLSTTDPIGAGAVIYADQGAAVTIQRSILRDNAVIGGLAPSDGSFPGADACNFQVVGDLEASIVYGGGCGASPPPGRDGAGAAGGAVYGNDADITIEQSILSNNRASGGDGATANGGDGMDGLDGTCGIGELPHPAGYGGDGGDGNDGGDGGDALGGAIAVRGGSLDIFTTAIIGSHVEGGSGAPAGTAGQGGEGGDAGTCNGPSPDGEDGAPGEHAGDDGSVHGAVYASGDAQVELFATLIGDSTGTVEAPAGESSTGIAADGDATVNLRHTTVVGDALTVALDTATPAMPSFEGDLYMIDSILASGDFLDADDGTAVAYTCEGRSIDTGGANVLEASAAACEPTGDSDILPFDATEYSAVIDGNTYWSLPGGAEMPLVMPLPGSMALDGALICTGPDQRGAAFDVGCDIGAVERAGAIRNSNPLVISQPDDLSLPAGSAPVFRYVFTDLETPHDLDLTAEIRGSAVPDATTWSVSDDVVRVRTPQWPTEVEVRLIATDPGGLTNQTAWFTVSTSYTNAQVEAREFNDDEYWVPNAYWSIDLFDGVYANDVHGYRNNAALMLDLPDGGTLDFSNAWGWFTFEPDEQLGDSTSFNYSYLACLTQGCLYEATVTLNVVAPSGVDDEVTGVTEGHTYSSTFSVLDNDSPGDRAPSGAEGEEALTALIETAPEHGTLELDADGTFTYEPDAGYTGTDSATYIVQNQWGGHSDPVTITVQVDSQAAPVANNDAYSASASEVTTVSGISGVLANDSDADGDSLTVTDFDATSTEGGTVAVLANGSFEYTPADGYTGTDSFDYTVSDGTDDATATVTITVTAQTTPNTAPAATDDEYEATAGQPLSVAASAGVLANDTDADGDALTVTDFDATSTEGGAVAVAGDGSLEYTPADDFTGTDSFDYTVSDGTDDATATVTTTVTAQTTPNTAPAATDDEYEATAGQPLSVAASAGVLANDTDADGDALTVTDFDATSTEGGAVAVAADGSLEYTPADGFTGDDTFGYTITDGTDSATATVTVTVTAPAAQNTAPAAADDAFDAFEGRMLTVDLPGVLANDTDPDGDTLTVADADASSTGGGSVAVVADGSFEYTPADGFTGTDTFDYTVSDGTAETSATVTITVAAQPNRAPVAADDAYDAATRLPLEIDAAAGVLTNDSDADGDTLTVTDHDTSSAEGGTVTVAADGSFAYTPAPDFSGLDSFAYTASDGATDDAATVTISVPAPVNLAPAAVDDAYDAEAGQPLSVDQAAGLLANDTDPDGDRLGVVDHEATTAEGGTVAVDADGAFRYAAADGFVGTDTFTYTISDGTDRSTATVSITVPEPVNGAPVVSTTSYEATAGEPLVVDAAHGLLAGATDAEGDALVVIAFDRTSAAGGTVEVAPDGSFRYVPPTDAASRDKARISLFAADDAFTGTDTFGYTISDGTDEVTATVTITVTAADDADDAGTGDQDGTGGDGTGDQDGTGSDDGTDSHGSDDSDVGDGNADNGDGTDDGSTGDDGDTGSQDGSDDGNADDGSSVNDDGSSDDGDAEDGDAADTGNDVDSLPRTGSEPPILIVLVGLLLLVVGGALRLWRRQVR